MNGYQHGFIIVTCIILFILELIIIGNKTERKFDLSGKIINQIVVIIMSSVTSFVIINFVKFLR
jgi:uncharacterized integral membrane protein